jgi:Holliday junction resolvase RusA-like endonuclease
MVEYQLLGDPTPLKRPRFYQGKVYDSQKAEKLINFLEIKRQHGKLPLITKPVHLEIIFIFEVPKSYSKKKRELTLGKPHCFKPDIDNLIKKILDEMTSACYNDDAIVYSISARKIYGIQAKTTFFFNEI